MAIRSFISKLVESDQRHRDVQSVRAPSPGRRRRRTTLETDDQKGESDKHDESNWLVSYADMMTLLCGFFVMMFTLSSIDSKKYESVKAEVAKTFKGDYHPPSTVQLAERTQAALRELGVEAQTKVLSTPTSVDIVFQSTLFFDTLSAEVKTEGDRVLQKVIAGLQQQQEAGGKTYRITVEGHTDSRPILPGTHTAFASNWELSGARASSVVRAFIDRGFAPEQFSAVGFADTRPELPSRTPAGEWDEEALSKNRRVILRISEMDENPENSAH